MRNSKAALICIIAGSILLTIESTACTVPVFRYALDNWPGKSDSAIENTTILNTIAEKILEGNSAVWIQIDSGNKTTDDAAFELLESRLKFFESVAELPEIDPNDPSSRIGPGPKLELKFSAFRIDRDNPVAKQIASSKLESLPKNEAWIAPVFGRGRVLGIWEASRMDEEGIDEACFYLTGACSCQVKVQNPGWDLVMNLDWNDRLHAVDSRSTKAPEPGNEDVAPFTPVIRPPTSDINLTSVVVVGLLIYTIIIVLRRIRSQPK